MVWERRGKKRYYYRSQWQNGRSARTYFGNGAAAQLTATADALQRVQREMEARHRKEEEEPRAAAEALLAKLCQQTDLLVGAALIAGGYHRHDRSAWRKKRECKPADRENGSVGR